MQTEFMRSNGLPYSPLQSIQIDEELRSALAAVQRFKGDFEGANAVELGAKDQIFYEVRVAGWDSHRGIRASVKRAKTCIPNAVE